MKTIKKVLVIDDEDDLRKLIQTCLELTAGWRVTTASSGQEGLAKAQTDPPDIILIDVMMPGMDGLTLLQHLRADASTQQIPVILLTAKGRSSTPDPFAQWNIQGTIRKPFKPLTLAEQITSVLSQSSDFTP
ncbi:MAG: response regulator [Oculatellaceae cyanobacterium Prado106]|nr:response regulator [Oculatellaceae cyanobacterium Prado106]